ncbi:MAG: sigma-54-dependent transcriptional regulator [Pirellulaceae bacterium]
MSQNPKTILIVDDEAGQRELLSSFVATLGCRTVAVASGEEALASLQQQPADMVLLDVRLPGISGMETLARIRQCDSVTPVLLITAHGELRQAVSAMKGGADDYLSKPVDLEELRAAILDALGMSAQPVAAGEAELPPVPAGLVFESPATRRLLQTIAIVAPSDAPILVRGETGTGKEVIARLIHAWSRRSAGPLVAANCTSIPDSLVESELFGHSKGAFTGAVQARDGVFRTAHGGTLFLDEIGELPLALQPKLLRALETGTITAVGSDASVQVDTRLVAATHRDLEQEVTDKRFREDLYYRINVVEIVLDPLRKRREDILPLARNYASQFSGGPVRLSPRASQCLLIYAWPGNVRELRNAMQRACLLCRGDIILPEHLPPKLASACGTSQPAMADTDRLSQIERATILATLEECQQNKTQAAKKLGISRRALIYKLHDIEAQFAD